MLRSGLGHARFQTRLGARLCSEIGYVRLSNMVGSGLEYVHDTLGFAILSARLRVMLVSELG